MPTGCLNPAPAAITTHTATSTPTRFGAIVSAPGAEHLHRGAHRPRGESLEPSFSIFFPSVLQLLVNLWMQQLLMWPGNNGSVYLPQQQRACSNILSGEADPSSRMHVLHGPPGSHHLHERQDDDDYVGGGTGMAVNFGAFVKRYYERIVESASEDKK